jgi:hypothetical protein
MEGRMFYLE